MDLAVSQTPKPESHNKQEPQTSTIKPLIRFHGLSLLMLILLWGVCTIWQWAVLLTFGGGGGVVGCFFFKC
jgi:hypothetical protein